MDRHGIGLRSKMNIYIEKVSLLKVRNTNSLEFVLYFKRILPVHSLTRTHWSQEKGGKI